MKHKLCFRIVRQNEFYNFKKHAFPVYARFPRFGEILIGWSYL